VTNLVDLADELTAAIRQLPRQHAIDHGFGLMLDDDGAPDRRRAQARTTLLAEHLLTQSIAGWSDRVVLMKGLEVAHLYPSLIARPFRDVDVLVNNADTLWEHCVNDGYCQRPNRRADIDHHHLPALRAPFGGIGLEVHHRPNTPGWASIEADLILDTAEPSRTGIQGIWRPRDDIHALLMALHGWKGGFTRQRDLYDAILLAAVSTIPIEETAREFNLHRCWRWTVRLAEHAILGRSTVNATLANYVLPRNGGIQDRRRVRLASPFLVANPVRVTQGHYREFQLGRAARRAF
jgi:hypothetical protein